MKRLLCMLLAALLFASCMTCLAQEETPLTLAAGTYVIGESISAGTYLVACPIDVETAVAYVYPAEYEKWYEYDQMLIMGSFVGNTEPVELTLNDHQTIVVLCGEVTLRLNG